MMSIFRPSLKQLRIPFTLLFAVCIVLIIAAAWIFPTPSGAKVEAVQQVKTSRKARRQAFVPGEILV